MVTEPTTLITLLCTSPSLVWRTDSTTVENTQLFFHFHSSSTSMINDAFRTAQVSETHPGLVDGAKEGVEVPEYFPCPPRRPNPSHGQNWSLREQHTHFLR